MNLGHRGANHPVKNMIKGKVEITSQNHGFEIEKKNFLNNSNYTPIILIKVDRRNRSLNLNQFFLFNIIQSNPGPQDSVYLFEEFIKQYKRKNGKKKRY